MSSQAYITAEELLKTLCLRNGDTSLSKASLYASYMTTVYNELKIDVNHKSVIRKFYINKLTNSLPIPDDCLMLLAVGYVNECNIIEPLWYNDNIPLDLLFYNTKSCDCNTCGGEHSYCGLIKSFDEVEEIVTINGTPYTNKKKTTILEDGTIYLTTLTATLNSDNEVVMIPNQEELCKVDYLPCGCVSTTPENIEKIKTSCGCGDINTNCGTYNRYIPKNEGYRIDESETQIMLDMSYTLDHIVLKYYTTINSAKDYRIPVIAMEAMFYGIMYYSSKMDKKVPMGDRALGGNWYNDYEAEKKKLSKRIHPNVFSNIMGAMGVTKNEKLEDWRKIANIWVDAKY